MWKWPFFWFSAPTAGAMMMLILHGALMPATLTSSGVPGHISACLSPDETGYPRLPIWTAPATCVHFHWTSCMHAAQPAGRFLLSTAPAGERSLPMVWGSSLPGSSAASLRAHHFFIWGAPQRVQRERGSTLVVFREPILFSYSSKASCRRQCYNTIKYDLDAQCCGLEADALLDILSFHLTCMQSCDR